LAADTSKSGKKYFPAETRRRQIKKGKLTGSLFIFNFASLASWRDKKIGSEYSRAKKQRRQGKMENNIRKKTFPKLCELGVLAGDISGFVSLVKINLEAFKDDNLS